MLYCAWTTPAHAAQTTYHDVFLRTERGGAITLTFVDGRTGLSATVDAPGFGHSIFAGGVLFQEAESGLARLAYADGRLENYPVVVAAEAGTAVDWVVSANERWLAWSVTARESDTARLATTIYVAAAGRGEVRQALRTASEQGLASLPVAISDDGATLFYTTRDDLFDLPAGERSRAARVTLVSLWRLEVATGAIEELTLGGNCPCATAFSGDGSLYAQVETSAEGNTLVVRDLGVGTTVRLSPARGAGGTAAGLLISADNALAAYTSTNRSGRVALVVADLRTGTQRAASAGLPEALRPLRFEAEGGVLWLGGVRSTATYKLNLSDGRLRQVAAYTWLGSLP
jgi:hypothetical protein